MQWEGDEWPVKPGRWVTMDGASFQALRKEEAEGRERIVAVFGKTPGPAACSMGNGRWW